MDVRRWMCIIKMYADTTPPNAPPRSCLHFQHQLEELNFNKIPITETFTRIIIILKGNSRAYTSSFDLAALQTLLYDLTNVGFLAEALITLCNVRSLVNHIESANYTNYKLKYLISIINR